MEEQPPDIPFQDDIVKTTLPPFASSAGMEVMADIYEFAKSPEAGGWPDTLMYGKRRDFFLMVLPLQFQGNGFLSKYRPVKDTMLQRRFKQGETYIQAMFPQVTAPGILEIQPEWPRAARLFVEYQNFRRQTTIHRSPSRPRAAATGHAVPNLAAASYPMYRPRMAAAGRHGRLPIASGPPESPVAKIVDESALAAVTTSMKGLQDNLSQMTVLLSGSQFRSVDEITTDLRKHLADMREARERGASELELEALTELITHAKSELKARRTLNEKFVTQARKTALADSETSAPPVEGGSS